MIILKRKCPVCDLDNESQDRISYAPPEWSMKKCVSCNMVYLENAPDPSELFTNLAWEKTTLVEGVRRDKKSPLYRKFSKLTRRRLHLFPRNNVTKLVRKFISSGNVLDVGCGSGDYVLNLPEQYTPYGIEVSTGLFQQGNQKFLDRKGFIINKDALSGIKEFEDNKLDAIIMRSFLEHDAFPLPTLKEAARATKKGGVIIIKVPNYQTLNRLIRGKEWCGFRFPDHVNYFTPDTLKKCVINSGLKIFKMGFMNRLPTSDNMWLIAVK